MASKHRVKKLRLFTDRKRTSSNGKTCFCLVIIKIQICRLGMLHLNSYTGWSCAAWMMSVNPRWTLIITLLFESVIVQEIGFNGWQYGGMFGVQPMSYSLVYYLSIVWFRYIMCLHRMILLYHIQEKNYFTQKDLYPCYNTSLEIIS